jgi:ParB family chromosome partitioning protein
LRRAYDQRSKTADGADAPRDGNDGRTADAVSLDTISHWAPIRRTYLGRVTKTHVLAAVREGVSKEATDQMAGMKKQDMAEAAEQLLVGTAWLPALQRTPRAAQGSAESPQAETITEAKDPEAYSVAAE